VHHPIRCTRVIVARLSGLAIRRGALAGLAVVAVGLPLGSAIAAPDEQPAATASVDFDKKDGTLYLAWSGQIAPGMAEYVRTAFAKYATVSHRVVLLLNSGGGQVEEGERVIHILQEIKQTHRLTTAVLHGKICASMCINVFLQGNDRAAARASLWVFHEAAKREADGTERMDMEETLRLFRRYYVPAGVSAEWLKTIVPKIKNANLWQTGGDLIAAKTGIIMYPLENQTPRVSSASQGSTRLN
jgi:hypothetical protein